MKMRQAALCVLLTLSGCDDQKRNAATPQEKAYGDWQDWHTAKRAVEMKADELLNAPGGADYPAIIEVYQKSGWPADIIDLYVGATIVGSYEDPKPARRPVQTLSEGFDLMEKSAQSTGEGSVATPQRLRMWFERGVGKSPDYVMPPIPELAACWLKVEKDSYDEKIDDKAEVNSCIALRKTLPVGTGKID
jgi:hypothetical protein